VEVSRRLLAAVPGSERAQALRLLALTSLSRWDEARAFAESRLQRSADDDFALRALAGVDIQQKGDLESAEQRIAQLVRNGKANAGDFNQLAWMRLEHGRVDEATIDYGQRAASLSGYGDASHLHTLASVYAEAGKTAEAYRVLLQSLAARPDEAPSADDWYVFGRLAEAYGLPDIARKYYKRVPAPARPENEILSTHALAARRLAAL
jgi:tetratricopeptide (TPR) repeat protein